MSFFINGASSLLAVTGNALSYAKGSAAYYTTVAVVGTETGRNYINNTLMDRKELEAWIIEENRLLGLTLQYPTISDQKALELCLLIEKMAPKIADNIRAAKKANSPELSSLFDNDQEFLNKVVEALLLRVIRRAAEFDQEMVTKSGNAGISEDPLVRIIAGLNGMIGEQFLSINSEVFKQAYNEPSPEIKSAQMNEMFAPLVDEMLKILMPKGLNDIPFRGFGMDQVVWDTIRTALLPDLLMEMYHYTLGEPYQTDEDRKVLDGEGGASTKALAETIAKKVVYDHGKELIKSSGGEVGAAVVKWLAIDPWSKDFQTIEGLVTNVVAKFAEAKGYDVKFLYYYAEKHVESIALHLVASLAKDGNENIVPRIAERVFGIVYNYLFIEKDTEGQTNYERIKNAISGSTSSEAQKAALFNPLVDTLIKEAGLETVEAVAMIKDTVIPKFLFEGFRDIVKFDAWIKKEKKILGTTLQYPTISDQKASELCLLIEKMALKVVDNIRITKKASSPELSRLLDDDQGFMKKAIEALLLRVIRRAAEFDQNIVAENENVGISEDPLVRIITGLSAMIGLGFSSINPEMFKQAYNESSPEIKSAKMNKMFAPLVDEMLKILMPKGLNDIPFHGFGMDQVVWETIRTTLLPDLLMEIYHYTLDEPYQTDEDRAILEGEGGASMKALAKTIAKKVVHEHGKELIKSSGGEVGAAVVKWLAIGSQSNDSKTIENLVANVVDKFADAKGREVELLYDHAEKHVESIALHLIASLAKDGNGNIIPRVAEKVVSIVYTYLFVETDADGQTSYERIKNVTSGPALSDTQKAALFNPLVDRLVAGAGLNAVDAVAMIKDTVIPKFLFESFRDIVAFDAEAEPNRRRLPELLLTALPGDITLNEATVRRQEAEDTVAEVDRILGVFSKYIGEAVDSYLHHEDNSFAKLINEHVFNGLLEEGQVGELTHGVAAIFDSKSTALLKTKEFVRTKVQESLLKIFVLIAEKTSPEGTTEGERNLKTLLPAQVTAQLLKMLIKHVKSNEGVTGIEQQFDTIQKNEQLTVVEKEKLINELFIPVAKDFIDLIGPDFEKALPVPAILQKTFAEMITASILPGLFSNVYAETTPWHYQADGNRMILHGIYGSNDVANFAGEVAQFAGAAVPYYMTPQANVLHKDQNPYILANRIVDSIAPQYFAAEGAIAPEAPAEGDALPAIPIDKEKKDAATSLLERNLVKLGSNDEVTDAWAAVAKYAEGFLLKIFAGISQTVHNSEQGMMRSVNGSEVQESKLLIDLLIEVLGEGAAHFNLISSLDGSSTVSGDLTSLENEHAIFQVFKWHTRRDVEGNEIPLLHEALESDFVNGEYASEEDRKKARLEKVYKPLANKLLELANLKQCPADFPVPKEMREKEWDKFSNQVLPDILQVVLQNVMSPVSIKQKLLDGVRLLKSVEKMVEDEDVAMLKDANEVLDTNLAKLESDAAVKAEVAAYAKKLMPRFLDAIPKLKRQAETQEYISDEEKNQAHLVNFYRPNVLEILTTLHLTDCPRSFLPSSSEENKLAMWEIFKRDVLPDILQKISPVEDPTQTTLDEQIGDLLLAFIQMAPMFAGNFRIINAEKVAKLGNKGLGHVIRKNLGGKTVIQLINNMLKDVKLGAPGEGEKVDEAALDEELRKELSGYISDEGESLLKGLIEAEWKSWQRAFDGKIRTAFGKKYGMYAMDVKKFFDTICRAIFISFLGPVWNFLIFKAAWFFLRIAINTSMGESVKRIGMSIMQNLILRVIDSFINRLLDPSKPLRFVASPITVDPLMGSFCSRMQREFQEEDANSDGEAEGIDGVAEVFKVLESADVGTDGQLIEHWRIQSLLEGSLSLQTGGSNAYTELNDSSSWARRNIPDENGLVDIV